MKMLFVLPWRIFWVNFLIFFFVPLGFLKFFWRMVTVGSAAAIGDTETVNKYQEPPEGLIKSGVDFFACIMSIFHAPLHLLFRYKHGPEHFKPWFFGTMIITAGSFLGVCGVLGLYEQQMDFPALYYDKSYPLLTEEKIVGKAELRLPVVIHLSFVVLIFFVCHLQQCIGLYREKYGYGENTHITGRLSFYNGQSIFAPIGYRLFPDMTETNIKVFVEPLFFLCIAYALIPFNYGLSLYIAVGTFTSILSEFAFQGKLLKGFVDEEEERKRLEKEAAELAEQMNRQNLAEQIQAEVEGEDARNEFSDHNILQHIQSEERERRRLYHQ